jgi:hypothetical protein
VVVHRLVLTRDAAPDPSADVRAGTRVRVMTVLTEALVDLGTPGGQVLRVVPDETERPVVFSSVRNLIATIVEAYDRGVVRVEGDYLELDDRAFGRLAAEREPALPWWPAYVAGEV